MIRSLLLLGVLYAVPALASASSMDSCMSLGDSAKASALRNELEKRGVPYQTDGDLVCVTSDRRDELIALMLKMFPPDSTRKLRVPPSPSGAPLNSTKLANVEEQELLEAELKKREIWFTKDETGAVWYEAAREKEVNEIKFGIYRRGMK